VENPLVTIKNFDGGFNYQYIIHSVPDFLQPQLAILRNVLYKYWI